MKAGFEVTVLTTLDCNFNCVYCFEGSRKGSLYMSQETARALLSWLKGLITERGYKRVFIVFYGGEPLLNRAIIDFIISEINNGKLPVRPRYCLITNGSLLNREDIIRWANMGLEEVRVTLDGPKEIHDARRPFKGGKGSYDVIVKNVEAILGLVGVSITVNFDKSTIGGVKGLIDEMAGRGWPSECLVIAGPNGSGKSTFLKLLLGLLKPISGSVIVEDEVVSTDLIWANRDRIAVVFENGFWFSGSLRENLLHSVMGVSDRELLGWLEFWRLDLPLDMRIEPMGSNLSTGQKKKLGLIRAVIRRPSLLIVDELLANLDALGREKAVELVRKLKGKTTLVITTNLVGLGLEREANKWLPLN